MKATQGNSVLILEAEAENETGILDSSVFMLSLDRYHSSVLFERRSLSLMLLVGCLLKWENQVIEDLQSLSCVPRHYLFSRHGNKDVLVMELLSGEDMSALR